MQLFEQTAIRTNLPILVDSRMLLCANSGGGKSYVIRKLLEEAGSQIMSIVLDVEGEFKTLREKYDFLLIGPTGDLPVSIKAAPLLPRKLLELNVSTIIDMSDLKMHERIQYVKKFLEALMELPRECWKPCLVIVDEAHMYCGQQEKQDSTHAVIDLMTRGRKRGLCGILATQRIAKLHKDAAAEANNYMVGRTGLDVDMRRASEILGFASRDDMLRLRDLEPGDFYCFGPAISRSVLKAKVAAVKTTHPRVGMDLKGRVTPPTERVKSILAKLGDLAKEAEEKAARTTEERRQRIRELERQAKAPQIDSGQIEAAERRGYDKAQKAYESRLEVLRRKLEQIAMLAQIPEEAIKLQGLPEVHRPPIAAPRPTPPRRPASDTASGLNRCERAVLSLLWNNPDRQFKKTLVGLFAGYSHKSGGFKNAICRLNSLGLIVRKGGRIQLNSEILER